MRIGTLKGQERSKTYARRKQIFALIAEDCFPEAKVQLQEVAQDKPQIFSWIGLEFLGVKPPSEIHAEDTEDAPY